MPWKRLPSEWRNKLPSGAWPKSDDQKNVYHKCSPEQARRIALRDPQINCFFYVRLELPPQYTGGDVVFFRLKDDLRKKLVGDYFSPQGNCDLYVKNGMIAAYYDPSAAPLSTRPLSPLGSFEMAGYGATVDVVCIFAANLVRDVHPGMTPLGLVDLAAAKQNSHTIAVANEHIYELLTKTKHAIVALQEKGISVLLSVMNHHQNTGWSEFHDQGDASQFAKQLVSAVDKYGLDGIDIDDEYSHNQDERRKSPTAKDNSVKNSLAMLAAKLRYEMRNEKLGKIISKALFEDEDFFGRVKASAATYRGKDGNNLFELEDLLTYGWDMAYWVPASKAMTEYVKPGRIENKKKLLLGFKSNNDGSRYRQVSDVDWLKSEGYGGAMVFDCQFQTGQNLMRDVINQLLK